MKAIVLYYSKTGTTKKWADKICADLNCPQIFIEPEEAYGNYIASVCRVAKERKGNLVPAFKTAIPDLTQYDTVFVGFPVWYREIPAFVAEFMRRCDLNGKTVIPFSTFGGKGVNWKSEPLESICPGAVVGTPFEQGIFKKDGYDIWMANILK